MIRKKRAIFSNLRFVVWRLRNWGSVSKEILTQKKNRGVEDGGEMVVKKNPLGSGAPGLDHVGVPLLVHHDPEAHALDERLEVRPQLIGGPHPPPKASDGH